MKDMSKITLSIVTPSYNQGEYIAETIESVLSQRGDFYIEYFIMDGGSKDASVDVIKKYEKLLRDGAWPVACAGITYHWVSEKDSGQTNAINKGFKRATGDIVSWINSDDLYHDGAFGAVADYFQKTPKADFVYGDGDVIDEKGSVQWKWKSRRYDYELLKTYDFKHDLFTNYIMQQSVFWRKNAHDRIGLLDEAFHYAMDYEYWVRAGAHGLRLDYMPVMLGKFRMIQNTKSLSSPTVFWPEALEIFRRYNGAEAMEPYLAHFFLNEGRHNGFDPQLARKQQDRVFKIWSGLGPEEQKKLKEKAEAAFPLACLMLAKAAYLDGEKAKARAIYMDTLLKNPLLFVNVHSRRYIVWEVLSKNVYDFKKKLVEKLKGYHKKTRA